MKRKLIKQMCHEWRENIWLILSLTIVFIVVWGGAFFLYLKVYGWFIPRGYDCTDVYSMNVRMIEKASNYYNEEAKGREGMYHSFAELMRRLRENPAVESAMFHWGALPYNFNYAGNSLTVIDDTITDYMGNTRQASPEVVDVMRLKSLTGKSRKQLREMLEKGEILIGNSDLFESQGHNAKELIGRKVFFGNDSAKVYRVGDVIENIRRNDYEPARAGTIILPLGEDQSWGQVAVRVKPGMGKKFAQDFKDNKDLRINGNVFLTEFESMADVREANQRGTEIDNRQLIILILFVLVSIFLGLLGTYWFKVQQRVGEIAIRKICGATRRDILGRIITEGLILLLCAVVIASAVSWFLLIPEMLESFGEPQLWKQALWCELGAAVVVALCIVVSLLYPALRAMRIEPAIAVKAE